MAILANPSYFEQERLGNTEQTLAAVRYTGDSRRYSNRSVVNQGRWPDDQDFAHGVWYVGFVPETVPEGAAGSGVAWFERNSNFEVEYSPEEIARILLSKNYLDLSPGGPIGDGDTVPGFDDKLRRVLGLEDEIEAGATYEDQLKELAGVDDAPATEDVDPVDALVNEFDRGALKDAVKAVREDTDEFNLQGKSMGDMAEFLVDAVDDPEAAVREVN